MPDDKVIKVERVRYEGPVYNLEVEEDESYTADGIAVHNCLCYAVAVRMPDDEFVDRLRGWMRGEEEWAAMDDYAAYLGLEDEPARVVEPGLLVSWGAALVTWLWGDEETMLDALGLTS